MNAPNPTTTQPPAAVPAGWKLVPVEPTEAMVDAAYKGGFGGGPTGDYLAMLAAAPAAPMSAQPVPHCLTCGDTQWIGGPTYAAPDEGGEPCPDCTISREDWIDQAVRVYRIAGDAEGVARECATYLWGEVDKDDLPDATDAALEDVEGRGPPPGQTGAPFQQRVQPWMLACFGEAIAADRQERNHRFLEEALELVQATGCTADEAHQLVDYVFGRPVGEPAQEVGGVMVTLAALCLAQGLDMHSAGEVELARIWTKVDAIRAKQAAKPKHSPLPAAPGGEAPAALRPGIPGNFITHRGAWRRALVIAEQHAAVNPPDLDDKAYWRRELEAFDRSFDRLWTIMGAA